MTRRLILFLTLAALIGSLAPEAEAVGWGKKHRRQQRYFLLHQKLENDKLRIYEEYGFSMHRLRVYGYGRILEHWKYYDLGLEFVFDEDSRLVKTIRFRPEYKRERIERFPGY